MKLTEIAAGDYSSIAGTWKSEEGWTYTVTNDSITIASSGSNTTTYTYGKPAGGHPGDMRYTSTWGVNAKIQNNILSIPMPDFYLSMANTGTNLGNAISPANQTIDKDAIWTGQGRPDMPHLAYKVGE